MKFPMQLRIFNSNFTSLNEILLKFLCSFNFQDFIIWQKLKNKFASSCGHTRKTTNLIVMVQASR